MSLSTFISIDRLSSDKSTFLSCELKFFGVNNLLYSVCLFRGFPINLCNRLHIGLLIYLLRKFVVYSRIL